MECPLCRGLYGGEVRRPKLLPCGHGFCQPCLQGRDRCPRDGQVFSSDGTDLPDDEYLLSLLAVPGRNRFSGDADAGGGLRLRCQDCAADARESCVDQGHRLGSQRAHWHRQVLDGLQRLAAEVDLEPGTVGQDQGQDELLRQLASGVEVTVDGGDGEDVWTATVQLGGSMAEWTEEAWALRQLLLQLQLRAEDELVDPFDVNPGEDESEEDVAFGLFEEARPVELVTGTEAEAPAELETESEEEDCGYGLMDVEPVKSKKRPRAKKPPAPPDDDEEELDVTVLTTSTDLSPERLSRVRRLVGVDCGKGPAESLRLLQAVTPHLEELQLRAADRTHLLAAHRMPRLRRLEVSGAALWDDPFLVPALEHGGGLERLQLCLSTSTAASLMLAHHRTLRLVQIMAPRPVPRTKAPPGSYYNQWVRLEHFQYRGRGSLEDPVSHRRSVYFPRRAPGDFPVLERVEFHEERSWRFDRQGLQRLEDLDVIRQMFPGVAVVLADEILDWRH